MSESLLGLLRKATRVASECAPPNLPLQLSTGVPVSRPDILLASGARGLAGACGAGGLARAVIDFFESSVGEAAVRVVGLLAAAVGFFMIYVGIYVV